MKTSVIIRRPALRAIVLSVCASGTCPRCRIVPDPTQSGRTKSKPFSKPKKRKLHFRCQRETQFKSTPQKPRKVPPQNKPKVQQKPSKVLPKKAPQAPPPLARRGGATLLRGRFDRAGTGQTAPQLCLQLCRNFVCNVEKLCRNFVETLLKLCRNFVETFSGQGRGRQEEILGRQCGWLLGGTHDLCFLRFSSL